MIIVQHRTAFPDLHSLHLSGVIPQVDDKNATWTRTGRYVKKIAFYFAFLCQLVHELRPFKVSVYSRSDQRTLARYTTIVRATSSLLLVALRTCETRWRPRGSTAAWSVATAVSSGRLRVGVSPHDVNTLRALASPVHALPLQWKSPNRSRARFNTTIDISIYF